MPAIVFYLGIFLAMDDASSHHFIFYFSVILGLFKNVFKKMQMNPAASG